MIYKVYRGFSKDLEAWLNEQASKGYIFKSMMEIDSYLVVVMEQE